MQDIYFYNTLHRRKEKFVPIDHNQVRVYVCGPTVYAPIHLGNARTLIFFDVLVRILRLVFGRQQVKYVLNITDIDDKIINQAQKQNLSPDDLVERMINIFQQNMVDLHFFKPDLQPRVTDHMPQMINFIQLLIDRGFAYLQDHNVLFCVRKFQQYGQFAKQDLKQLQTSSRMLQTNYKEHTEDFVLWKSVEHHGWESPWGYGRPGWHLECSVLSYEYLGEQYDIHGGGQDLIFPHHQNDIAQSQAVFDKVPARYWLHTGMLYLDEQKMSKSTGNIITLQDALQKYCDGDANLLRLALLLTHYRQPMCFNEARLQEARDILSKWQQCFYGARYTHVQLSNYDTAQKPHRPECTETALDEEVVQLLLDDVNLPSAIHAISHKLHDKKYRCDFTKITRLKNVIKSLGFMLEDNWHLAAADYKLLADRQQARNNQDYELADLMRKQLNQKGIEVEDAPDACICYPKL